MDVAQEILARIKRIENHLGIPADLPPECDIEGCKRTDTSSFTTGWPKAVTIRRCPLHPYVDPNVTAQ